MARDGTVDSRSTVRLRTAVVDGALASQMRRGTTRQRMWASDPEPAAVGGATRWWLQLSCNHGVFGPSDQAPSNRSQKRIASICHVNS
jgi:hypothetical protein